MAHVAKFHRFSARMRARGSRILTVVCHFATKIDPTLLQLQKKLRRILRKLLNSTLTWAIQFSESSFHHRDMFQSRQSHATKSWKITWFGQNRLRNSRTTFRTRAIIFSRGDIAPPPTHTYSESPFQGLSEYIWVWGSTSPHCGDMGSRTLKLP